MVPCMVVGPLPKEPTIERFLYDFIYDSEALIEMNVLLCDDVATAYEFMDDLYMELHGDASARPDRIRLRHSDSEEALVVMATHFDGVN